MSRSAGSSILTVVAIAPTLLGMVWTIPVAEAQSRKPSALPPILLAGTPPPGATAAPQTERVLAPIAPGPAEPAAPSTQPLAIPPVPEGTPQANDGKVQPLNPPKPAGKKPSFGKKRKATTDSLAKSRGVDPTKNSAGIVIVGEAQLLPERVLRARYLYKSAHATQGFDADGKKIDQGFELAVQANIFTLEYGISDRFNFQMIVPTIARNQLSIDAATFRRSQKYEDQYQKLIDSVSPTLISSGLCSSTADCRTQIDAGLALKATDVNLELPTGETYTARRGVPIKDIADSMITTAATPSDGKTGLGDIQIALGYTVFKSSKQMATLGLGLRWPTGKAEDVPQAYRRSGTGFRTLGLAIKYDFRIAETLMLSFSEQAETYLNKSKRRRSSLLDPSQFNSADPTVDDPNAVGSPDGEANVQTYQRKGLNHVGFLRLAYGLGGLHPWLTPVVTTAAYGYTIDSVYQIGTREEGPALRQYLQTFGVIFDGLGLRQRIPLTISYAYETPISGKNVALATATHTFTVQAYTKF